MARDRSGSTEVSTEDAELAELQAQLDAEGQAPEGDGTEPKAEKKKVVSKNDMPEGFGTPVDFVHYLKKERNVDVKPQIIYGHVKNSKTFQEFTDRHTDGRTRVDLAKALTWWDEKEARKANKAAEDAAKASEPASK